MLVFTCIQIPANAVEVDDIYNVTDAAEIDYEMVYDGYYVFGVCKIADRFE